MQEHIRQHNLLAKEESLLLAVSGGKDSVCMLQSSGKNIHNKSTHMCATQDDITTWNFGRKSSITTVSMQLGTWHVKAIARINSKAIHVVVEHVLEWVL